MRHLLAAVAASALLAGSALAADLPSTKSAPLAPISTYSWTGFYVGVETGANMQTVKTFGFDATQTSGIYGALVGYNYQIGKVVLGVEGDGGGLFGGVHAVTPLTGPYANVNTSTHYFGDVRGRLGYAIEPRALLYAAGGVAFGDEKTVYSPRGPAIDSARTGWTIGAGLEYALFNNCIGRVEYRYTDLGSSTYAIGDHVRVTSNEVVVAAIYKFGAPAVAMVSAKY